MIRSLHNRLAPASRSLIKWEKCETANQLHWSLFGPPEGLKLANMYKCGIVNAQSVLHFIRPYYALRYAPVYRIASQ